MQGLVLKIRAWWNIADKTAKTVTVVGVLFLVTALLVTFTLASQPDYVVLYADLGSADAGRVINKLKDLKVPFRIGGDGATIEVPKGQKDEVRMKLASEGLPGQASGLGKGWLDKSSIGHTQEQEKTISRVMLEEELQKTIESLEPVLNARVHLTTGEDGAFADQQVKPSADVVVHLKPGANLAPDQVSGVVHIISRSVNGLEAKEVSVVDGQGRVLFDGTSEVGGGTGIYAIKRREEKAYARALQEEISRHLDTVLGAGKSIVTVECGMNFDTEQSDKTINTPSASNAKPSGKTLPNTMSETTSTETFSNGASAPGGRVGTTANVPGGPGANTGSTPSGKSYSDEKVKRDYAFDIEQLRTQKAPGKVEKLTVSVLLDEKVEQPTQAAIQNYLNGVVGIPAGGQAPPGTMVTLAKTKFDKGQADAVDKAAKANAASAQMDKYFSFIPAFALIVAAFLVMKGLGKQSIKLQAPQMPMVGSGSPGGGSPALTGAVLDQGGALVQMGPDQILEKKLEVAPIPEKFDVAFEQIARMIGEKPTTVGLLIKSWMMEDRN